MSDLNIYLNDIMLNFYKGYNGLKNSSLSNDIVVLINLRVSQINRCVYCCERHLSEGKNLGINQEKLHNLQGWRINSYFTEKEKITLLWCETLTKLSDETGEVKNKLKKFYTDKEILELSAYISLMNALNRMAIGFKEQFKIGG